LSERAFQPVESDPRRTRHTEPPTPFAVSVETCTDTDQSFSLQVLFYGLQYRLESKDIETDTMPNTHLKRRVNALGPTGKAAEGPDRIVIVGVDQTGREVGPEVTIYEHR